MATISGTEFGWCLEHEEADRSISYLTVDVDIGLFDWTKDNSKAIRFCRREDAEMVAAVIGEDVDRVAEHGWG